MALETMMGIEEIAGEKVLTVTDPMDTFGHEEAIRVNHNINEIAFRIQNGPIKENGKNGCQVDHLIAVASHIIRVLNNKFPDDNNADAIESLEEALRSLEKRKLDREARNVEGFNKA